MTAPAQGKPGGIGQKKQSQQENKPMLFINKNYVNLYKKGGGYSTPSNGTTPKDANAGNKNQV